MSTIPPTANAPQVVRITSVKAVLARLNLKISIDDILKDIQEEEQANISLTVLSGCKSGLIPYPISNNERFQSLSNQSIHSLLLARPPSSPTLPSPPIPIHQQAGVTTSYSNLLKRLSLAARFQIRSCHIHGSNHPGTIPVPRSSPSSARHVSS